MTPSAGRRGDDPAEREFERLRRPFAEELERWPDFVAAPQDPHDVTPLADIEETDDAYLLDVELPGVRPHDVELQVERNKVVVTGERRRRQCVGRLRHRTRTTGRFVLAVTLPLPIDGAAVTASFDDGVLSVVVPKAERDRRRRIPLAPRS